MDTDSSDDGRYNEVGVLEWYDVFSLITNKMVGTGIYTAPSTVLVLTGSKSVAMGLWVVGFVYTLFRFVLPPILGPLTIADLLILLHSMFIYLEYSTVLPHTGGELVYVGSNLVCPETRGELNSGIVGRDHFKRRP
jgi:hypothetical protein